MSLFFVNNAWQWGNAIIAPMAGLPEARWEKLIKRKSVKHEMSTWYFKRIEAYCDNCIMLRFMYPFIWLFYMLMHFVRNDE